MRKLNIFNKKSTGWGKLSTLLAVFILLLIVTSSTSARADGGYDFVSGNLQYKINEDGKTVTLVRYDGDEPSGELIIPATVTNGDKEYSVTAIGDIAFSICTSLTSVTIPESVTSIGEWAFESCTSLTSVTIPEGITSIGYQVFFKCTSLTSVTIPEGVTSIGNSAFKNCSSLTSVTIPESVTSIGEWAFSKCTSLTSVTIPEGVTSIGKYAFGDVRHIINKSKCTDADHWGAIHEGGIVYGDFVYEDDTKLLVYIGKGGEVTIPKGVTTIGQEAFLNYTSLTSVTIPEGVTSIDKEAFRNCTNLTSVTIPESVTSIGMDAFYNCTNIENVYLYANPDNLAWNGKNNFKKSGETKCHVLAEYIDKYETKFKDEVNVTFEGDVIQLTADYINTSKISDVTYTGKAFTPEIEVKYGDKTLTPGTDYTITYTNNINAGTAKATITGITNLCIGSRDIEFTIAPAPVSVAAENKTKTFGESDPELTATVSGLVNNESPDLITYTLTRTEGGNVGEYAITAKGDEKQGNYEVSFVDATLTITKATPKYTLPIIPEQKCNATLNDITLPEGFAFAPNSEELTIGENILTLTYNPDENNYETVTGIKVTITVKDHEYGTPTYTWSNDLKTCDAKVVCKNDANHFVTEKATITSKVTTPATTEAKGVTTYSASFKNTLFTTQTKAVEDIDKLEPEPEPQPEPNPEPQPNPEPEPQPNPEPEPQPEPEPDPQNPSTPVSSIDNGGSNVKVWSYAHTIYIASTPDSQYKIIDLQGRTIKSATTKSSYEEVNINNSGIYVV
ncbi:MAG: leucine-rich repeat protein, partial [Bacteroidales bacterium]|nr:leucine-rich repeat protein [Bacteroidales bacterium]